MKKIIEELGKAYGPWMRCADYMYNCVLTKYSNNIYLNALFVEPEYKNNVSYLEKNGVIVGDDLKDFYKTFNGITLFSHSFVIFGYIETSRKGYCPLNAASMNLRIRFDNKSWNDNYFSIGEYGKYDFCLKRKDASKTIYIIDSSSNIIVKTFSSFNQLIEYSVKKLMALYDQNGLRKNAPKNSNSWLDNMSVHDNIFN